jgi:regulator of sirC expression with transglutaminase-like and TPR domain
MTPESFDDTDNTADSPAEAEPHPAQGPALTRKSSEALLRGEVGRAVEFARAATNLDPSYALGWRTLGLALERSGKAAAAVAAYEEYLRRTPQGPQSEMVRQRMQALDR